MVRFNIKLFFVYAAILIAVFHVMPLDPLRHVMANLVTYSLLFLGLQAKTVGPVVITKFGKFVVVNECLGVVSISTFWALMLVSVGLHRRTKVLFSALALFVFPIWNYIRIVLSIYIGKSNFEVMHFSLWMVSTALIVLMYYLSTKANSK